MRCPLVHVCIWFVLGILIADGLTSIIFFPRLLLVAIAAIFFFALLICHIKSFGLGAYISMALFSLMLGMALFSFRFDRVRDAVPSTDTQVIGQVKAPPIKKLHTWAVRLRSSDGSDLLAYIRVTTPPSVGDTLSLSPLVVNPTCPLDITDSTFASYYRYLFFSGISSTLYTDSLHTSVRQMNGHSLSLDNSVIRQRISEIYNESGITGPEGAIIESLTTGNRTGLSDQIRSDYSRAGVSHVLALSGYHLSLIYAFLQMFFLSRFVTLRWRWVSHLFILALIWAFAWMTGLPPSLFRATIMISVMILSGILNRNALSLNSLAFAAIIMLSINPLTLFDVGFQLSFVSMLSIIVVGIPLIERLNVRRRVSDNILSIVIITLVCSLFTAPLVAFYFHQIPILSVVTNLCLAILLPLLLLGAFGWWVAWLIPALLQFFTPLLLSLVSAVNHVVGYVASIPWAAVEVRMNLLSVTLFYIFLCAVVGIFYYLCKPKQQI